MHYISHLTVYDNSKSKQYSWQANVSSPDRIHTYGVIGTSWGYFWIIHVFL